MKKIFKIISTFIKVRYFSKWTSRDKLLEYQEKQVEKHLKFLKESSPYFKTHKITEDFTMNKAFMMENFDELNTLGVKKDEAMDIASYLDDPQLLMYGLTKKIDDIQRDPSLTSEKRTEEINRYKGKLEELKKQYLPAQQKTKEN